MICIYLGFSEETKTNENWKHLGRRGSAKAAREDARGSATGSAEAARRQRDSQWCGPICSFEGTKVVVNVVGKYGSTSGSTFESTKVFPEVHPYNDVALHVELAIHILQLLSYFRILSSKIE